MDWVAWIMLGLFLGILLVTGIFWTLARREVWEMRRRAPRMAVEPIPESNLPGQWLAIRSGNVAAVQQALGLANAHIASTLNIPSLHISPGDAHGLHMSFALNAL